MLATLTLATLAVAVTPRDWRGVALGMDRASFDKVVLALKQGNGNAECTPERPFVRATSERKLFPEVSFDKETVRVRFGTPRAKSVEVCKAFVGDARLEARFLDGALAYLLVDARDLAPSDLRFLAVKKYGEPHAQGLGIEYHWNEPSDEEGWRQDSALSGSSAALLWQDPKTFVVVDLGNLEIHLVDRESIDGKLVATDKLPDPTALHHAELLKRHAF